MDNDILGKLMAKKGADDHMSPEYKSSKMAVLKALHDEMTKMMGGDLNGLKKVTVAAPDKAGLQEGLAKAKDMMSKDAPEGAADDHEHEAMEPDADEDEASEEMEAPDADDAPVKSPSEMDAEEMTPAQIQEHIQMLQDTLKKKMLG